MAGEPILGLQNFKAFEQDPFTTALKAYQTGMQAQGQGLENQRLRAESPYWQQIAENQAKLGQSQAEYFGPSAQSLIDYQKAQASAIPFENAYKQALTLGVPSDIAYKMAQAQEAQARAAKQRFFNEHPNLMLPGGAGEVAGYMNLAEQRRGSQPFVNPNGPGPAPGYQTPAGGVGNRPMGATGYGSTQQAPISNIPDAFNRSRVGSGNSMEQAIDAKINEGLRTKNSKRKKKQRPQNVAN